MSTAGPRPTVQRMYFLTREEAEARVRRQCGEWFQPELVAQSYPDERIGFNRVPAELRARTQWVVWRYTLTKDRSRWTKVPFQARDTRRKASSTDPATWDTFEAAEAAFLASRTNPGPNPIDGIGYVFSADDPYVGIDFDASKDSGGVKKWAFNYLELLNSYTEQSPSGNGVKVIVKGVPPEAAGRKRTGMGDGTGAIEVYSQGRFFTITAERLDRWAHGVEDRTEALHTFYTEIFPPKAKAEPPSAPKPMPQALASDDDILRRAFAARNGGELEALFRGDTSRNHGDDSSADLALCNHLAFWFRGDESAIDRVFRRSGLMRAKWDENRGGTTYGQMTIAKALEGRTEFYEPERSRAPSANGKHVAVDNVHGLEDRPDHPPALDLILGSKDRVLSCAANSREWLAKERKASARYDTFRRMVLLDAEPLTDQHIVDLTIAIEVAFGTPWCQDHIRSALLSLAHANQFSSLQEYLDSLTWDGETRLENFFSDHYGCDQTPYHAEVGRILFLSAVARAYQPGTKVDTVPVLIGRQGCGKSRGIAALCPVDDWFTDDIGNDMFAGKAGEGLQAKWIVELAELARVNRSTIEVVKSFISRQTDRYRPAYGRIAQDFPRTCVFIATTNDDQPLQDTENRRYLPVRVGDADPAVIATVRDQLWAEAVVRFKKGEKWWIAGPNLAAEAAEHVGTARATDAWEDILRAALGHRTQTTVIEAAEILRIPTGQLGRSEQMRISNALKMLGFSRKRGERPLREWFYERETVPT